MAEQNIIPPGGLSFEEDKKLICSSSSSSSSSSWCKSEKCSCSVSPGGPSLEENKKIVVDPLFKIELDKLLVANSDAFSKSFLKENEVFAEYEDLNREAIETYESEYSVIQDKIKELTKPRSSTYICGVNGDLVVESGSHVSISVCGNDFFDQKSKLDSKLKTFDIILSRSKERKEKDLAKNKKVKNNKINFLFEERVAINRKYEQDVEKLYLIFGLEPPKKKLSKGIFSRKVPENITNSITEN
jgi:hypothetical protein